RPLSRRELQFDDTNRDKRCVLQRWEVRFGERMAGFAELTQFSETYHPKRFLFRVCVLPEFEEDRLNEPLLSLVINSYQNHRGSFLRSLVRDDQQHLKSVLERSGFKPTMRFQDKILHLKEPGTDSTVGRGEAAPQGIEVKTLSELQSNPDCH